MPHPGRSIASALPQALSPRTLRARGRAGQGLVVGVDGATGSGKTTLAAAVLRGLDHVEGCGALAALAQPFRHLDVLRVLVSAPEDLRHARLARRDSYSWDVAAWEEQERQVAQAWRDSPGLGPDLVLPTGAQGLASAGPPTGPAPA